MPSTTRLCLTLTGALLLVAVGGAMHMASFDATDKAAAFAAEGRTVTGTVEDAHKVFVARALTYELTVSFRAADGAKHECWSVVPNTIFDRAVATGKTPVTYLPARPATCYLDTDRPWPENNPIFAVIKFVAWGAALVAIASLFFGGRAAPQSSPAREAHASNAPRQGFGRRNTR